MGTYIHVLGPAMGQRGRAGRVGRAGGRVEQAGGQARGSGGRVRRIGRAGRLGGSGHKMCDVLAALVAHLFVGASVYTEPSFLIAPGRKHRNEPN